jgi:DNA-binding NtrC family response regulator
MPKPRILIVEDEAIVREDLRDLIQGLGYAVVGDAMTGRDAIALALAAELRPDLVLMDIQLKGAMDGVEAAIRIRNQEGPPVVFLTAFANEQIIDRAKEACPYGYLTKPFNDRAIRATIELALHRFREERAAGVPSRILPGPDAMPADSFHGIIGSSEGIRVLCTQVTRVARVDTTVLIEGETGSGKELVARAIHQASARSRGPFVAVNCAGLTETLAAAELYGHRRGAFTGAVGEHTGIFETARGGTVFLDEIGDIPKSQQAYLLRVLEEHEVTRVGESVPRKTDVRVVAATHRCLDDEVAAGRFRADLLYRIRVARLFVPPLRERAPDLPLLAAFFLARFCGKPGAVQVVLGEETLRVMEGYAWPGNVRELKNAIEYAALRCHGNTIRTRDFPPEVLAVRRNPVHTGLPAGDERGAILAALERTGGNRSEAARVLGISRATFYRRLSELGLDVSGDGPRSQVEGPQPGGG